MGSPGLEYDPSGPFWSQNERDSVRKERKQKFLPVFGDSAMSTRYDADGAVLPTLDIGAQPIVQDWPQAFWRYDKDSLCKRPEAECPFMHDASETCAEVRERLRGKATAQSAAH